MALDPDYLLVAPGPDGPSARRSEALQRLLATRTDGEYCSALAVAKGELWRVFWSQNRATMVPCVRLDAEEG